MAPQENQYQPDLTKNPGSNPIGPASTPPMANTPLPNTPANPPAPQGPTNQFDFMLKDPQAPKGKLDMLNNLPKPALILGVLGVVLILFLILSSLFGGGTNNSAQIVDLAARDQEIIRVSTAFQRSFTDPNDMNVATTTLSTLSSQQIQYISYLKKTKAKYKPSQLVSHLDKKTDVQLQNAVLNNSFDAIYLAYLNGALQDYQKAIQSTAPTSTNNFKKILDTAYGSNKILLTSPQFAANPGG